MRREGADPWPVAGPQVALTIGARIARLVRLARSRGAGVEAAIRVGIRGLEGRVTDGVLRAHAAVVASVLVAVGGDLRPFARADLRTARRREGAAFADAALAQVDLGASVTIVTGFVIPPRGEHAALVVAGVEGARVAVVAIGRGRAADAHPEVGVTATALTVVAEDTLDALKEIRGAEPPLTLSIFVALDTKGAVRMTDPLTTGGVAHTLDTDLSGGVTHPCQTIGVGHTLDADLLVDVAHPRSAVGL